MNRRDFIKRAAGTAVVLGAPNVLGRNPPVITDEANIITSDDPSQWTTREVRDHNVLLSYVGSSLSTTMNDFPPSALGWELLGYSPNIEHLLPGIDGNLTGTALEATEADAGLEYTLKYRAPSTTAANTQA